MSQSILSDDLYRPDFPSLGLFSTWFGVALIGLTAVFQAGQSSRGGYWAQPLVEGLQFVLLALILVALLGKGVDKIIIALVAVQWAYYARTVRGSALVERRKEYVQASRLVGTPARRLMLKHILPNTLTPVFVTATLNFGLAILIEATLSFLGVGMPPDQPSLGTLIRVGNQYLFSGSWWIVLFPSIQLCILVVSVNMLGDWLRDALNPKLR